MWGSRPSSSTCWQGRHLFLYSWRRYQYWCFRLLFSLNNWLCHNKFITFFVVLGKNWKVSVKNWKKCKQYQTHMHLLHCCCRKQCDISRMGPALYLHYIWKMKEDEDESLNNYSLTRIRQWCVCSVAVVLFCGETLQVKWHHLVVARDPQHDRTLLRIKLWVRFTRRSVMIQINSRLRVVLIFYASAQRTVAGGIMVLSCLFMCSCICACVHSCAHPKTLLTWYLAEYLTHFHQTYVNNALWDRGECFTIWGH